MLDLPFCNAATFQVFLDEFAMEKPSELKIMFLDNGAFHKAKKLKIPENIILVFLPPYTPELNPAEKVWWVLKREINLKVFESIKDLQNYLDSIIKIAITKENIIELTSFETYMTPFQTVLDL
jgi:transposase